MGNGNSTNKLFIAATVAAVSAGVAYFAYTQNLKEQQDKKEEGSCNDGCCGSEIDTSIPPKITKDNLIKLLEEMNTQLANVVMQLVNIEQKLREESANGQAVPEADLRSYLSDQFERGLKTISTHAYTKYNVSEEEVQHALVFYHEDAAVIAQLNKLQQVIQAATGQPITEADGTPTPDIPSETMLAILEDTFECMCVTMEEACQQILDENVEMSQRRDAIQLKYTQMADAATMKVFESYNVSREAFQNATLKYHQDPQFIAKMNELHQKQSQRFQAATERIGLQ